MSAVFESLRAVAECVVAEAHDWERVLGTALWTDGFGLVQCERSATSRDSRFAARHECGAWCVVLVSDLALVKAESIPEHARRLLGRFGCYCVRREVRL